MKNLLITAGLTVIIAMGLSSCGKKAQEQDNPSPKSLISDDLQSGEIEETHKELQTAIIAGDLTNFRQILDTKRQVNLNKILADNQTLLTTSIIYNQPQMAQLLFYNGASIDGKNKAGESPLMVASRVGNLTMARFLVSSKADINSQDANGNTALHLAILSNHKDMARFLLTDLPVDYNIINKDKKTTLQLAQIFKMTEIEGLLSARIKLDLGLSDSESVTSIFTLGNYDLIKVQIETDPDILTHYDYLNFYALVISSHNHDDAVELTRLLLNKGLNIQGPSNALTTPLIETIKKHGDVSYLDLIKIILDYEINLNIQDQDGKTALIWAIHLNSAVITKALLEKRPLTKYSYFENGKIKKMKACDEARGVRRELKTGLDKKANEEIMRALNCGLRGLF